MAKGADIPRHLPVDCTTRHAACHTSSAIGPQATGGVLMRPCYPLFMFTSWSRASITTE